MKYSTPAPQRTPPRPLNRRVVRARLLASIVALAGILNASPLSNAAPGAAPAATPTVPARAPLPPPPGPRASQPAAPAAPAAVEAAPPTTPAPQATSTPSPTATVPPTPAPSAAPSPAPTHAAPAATGHEAHDGPTPEEALATLRSGNERFIDGIVAGPHRDEDRRIETAAGQHPIAGILSCADSRVPVEVVFDQGIGDLFVVRVAGNIAGTSELASLQYGVEHLNLPLVVVMGHTRCGAVKAALSGANPPGPLGELLSQIAPSVENVKSQNIPESARLAATVRANVRYTLAQLQRDPVIGHAVAEGKTRLVGAVYDIGSGVVQWIDAAPAASSSSEPEMLKPAATAAPSPRMARPALPAAPSHDDKPSAHTTVAEPHSSATPTKSGSEHAAADKTSHGEHDKTADSSHGEESATTKPATASTAKRDNWVMLGSMLAGASGLSIGVIQWLGSRKSK